MSEDEPERITLEGREFTVSVNEKVSTGDYESFNPHATIKGEIPAPKSELDADTRAQVRRELIGLHDDLQSVIQTTIDRRLSDDQPGPETSR